jgi:hypothetical protein
MFCGGTPNTESYSTPTPVLSLYSELGLQRTTVLQVPPQPPAELSKHGDSSVRRVMLFGNDNHYSE